MENKIPKIIHYAWFGGTMPEHTKTYIKTWEKCNPDYQLKLWNENTFNINSYAFTREAYTYKKWAFIADFVRFWVLYHHGGIWLDTDVEVFRPFDDLLKLEYFIGNNSLNSHLDFSIIGACKGNPFIRLGMEEYLKRTFIDRNGNLNCEFSPKSLIENVMNRVYARHGIKVVKGTYDLDSLKTQQKKSQTTLYAIDNSILNSVHNTGNGKSFACHHHEGTWIKGNRLNISDFTPEEIMEQRRKLGIYSTSKKENTKDAPELLLIANTILCNYSMANNPGLTDGRMGVCLFLYEYARHTGIKKYEEMADDLLDNVLKILHKGHTHDNTIFIAGIGIGLIYLITHDFLEDTDDNDTLEEIDKQIFDTLESTYAKSAAMISSSLYFIYRCLHYRACLDRKHCQKLARHIIGLFQEEGNDNEEISTISSYILSNSRRIQEATLTEEDFHYHISTLSKTYSFDMGDNPTNKEKQWFNFLFGTSEKYTSLNRIVIRGLCQNCFYDADRILGLLCSSGLITINKNNGL